MSQDDVFLDDASDFNEDNSENGEDLGSNNEEQPKRYLQSDNENNIINDDDQFFQNEEKEEDPLAQLANYDKQKEEQNEKNEQNYQFNISDMFLKSIVLQGKEQNAENVELYQENLQKQQEHIQKLIEKNEEQKKKQSEKKQRKLRRQIFANPIEHKHYIKVNIICQIIREQNLQKQSSSELLKALVLSNISEKHYNKLFQQNYFMSQQNFEIIDKVKEAIKIFNKYYVFKKTNKDLIYKKFHSAFLNKTKVELNYEQFYQCFIAFANIFNIPIRKVLILDFNQLKITKMPKLFEKQKKNTINLKKRNFKEDKDNSLSLQLTQKKKPKKRNLDTLVESLFNKEMKKNFTDMQVEMNDKDLSSSDSKSSDSSGQKVKNEDSGFDDYLSSFQFQNNTKGVQSNKDISLQNKQSIQKIKKEKKKKKTALQNYNYFEFDNIDKANQQQLSDTFDDSSFNY